MELKLYLRVEMKRLSFQVAFSKQHAAIQIAYVTTAASGVGYEGPGSVSIPTTSCRIRNLSMTGLFLLQLKKKKLRTESIPSLTTFADFLAADATDY
jgi:hypothetical protein